MNQDLLNYGNDEREPNPTKYHFQQFGLGWNVGSGVTEHEGYPVTAMDMSKLTWRNAGYRIARMLRLAGIEPVQELKRPFFDALASGRGLPNDFGRRSP